MNADRAPWPLADGCHADADLTPEEFARAAACWNACLGIPLETIADPSFAIMVTASARQVEHMRRRERLHEEYRAGFDAPPAD